MKKLSILFLIMGAGFVSHAQDLAQKNVPAVVVNAFQQKFPNQSAVEWELKKGLYEAEFEISNMEHNVYLDSTGKIVKHKEDILISALPAVVTASIQKNFKGYKVDDAKKIEVGTIVTYKVDVEKGSEERKVTFSADGKIEENKLD